MIATWPAPLPDGKTSEELLLSFDFDRDKRVLILPAWFDEANKMRRFTVQTMRALDATGIDSFLPDLPGCNESLIGLESQTIASWQSAAKSAATQFGATHILSLRAGAIIAPADLPGWQYAPQSGAKTLRAMLRARMIAAREAGIEESTESLLASGRADGLTLAGWRLGAAFVSGLETAQPSSSKLHSVIAAKDLGGPGLWLRAEASEDQSQVDQLTQVIVTSTGTRS